MTVEDGAGPIAVVSGGTDGIGAATAMHLRQRGARVIAIGRSEAKARALVAESEALRAPGSIETIVADFSTMKAVDATVDQLARVTNHIDLLLHTVGILLTKAEHTDEGIEKDFAVSYLSRFVFLEAASRRGLLTSGTRMVNVAASSPRVPRYAQMEFSSLTDVQARVGMKGHGQAQLANDLLTAQAAARYGITAVGYGPGSVRTSIRREISPVIRALMKPFFHYTTRNAAEVGREIADILLDKGIADGTTAWFGKNGPFAISPFIADQRRQQDLLNVSLQLADLALGR